MRPAILVLEDGRIFRGSSFGKEGEAYGPVRVCTAMSGYQETLTDPDFAGSLLCFTTPHIGNTGWNDDDSHSERIQAEALIIREKAPRPSNFRSTRSLDDVLAHDGILAVEGIDTRALMRHLSEHGPLWGALSTTSTDCHVLQANLLARKNA